MKRVLVGAAIVLLAAGCGQKPVPVVEAPVQVPAEPAPQVDMAPSPAPWVRASSDGTYISRREGKEQVLYRLGPGGERSKTAVSVSYDWDVMTYPVDIVMTVSDTGQLVAYNVWDSAKKTMLLFVVNIDGAGKRQVAEQQAPEGHGELSAGSVAFTPDSSSLVYQEQSGSEEGGPVTTTYIVDLATTTTSTLSTTTTFGYIKSLSPAGKNDAGKLVYGLSEMLGGQDANKAAGKAYGCRPGPNAVGPCNPDGSMSMPNGFYIRDLKKSASYTIAKNAVIELIPEDGGVDPRPARASDLARIVKQDALNKKSSRDYLGTPFQAIEQDGQIVMLVQSYIP